MATAPTTPPTAPRNPITRISRASKLAATLTALTLLTIALSLLKPLKFPITASQTLSFHHAFIQFERIRLYLGDNKSTPTEVAINDPRAPPLLESPTISNAHLRVWSTTYETTSQYAGKSDGRIDVTLQKHSLYTLSLLGPFAAVAALTVYLLRRDTLTYRRSLAGLCPRCHYDLRASPTQCPECGLPTTP